MLAIKKQEFFKFLVIISFYYEYGVCNECKCDWSSVHTKAPNTSKLEPLCGKNLTVCDESADDAGDRYCYYVGICMAPLTQHSGAAIMQMKKQGNKLNAPVVIGKLSNSSLTYADDWMMLHYDAGAKYHSHCGNEERRGMLFMTCKIGEKKGKLRLLLEDNGKAKSCSYLFEFEHESVCSESTVRAAKKLSAGSVLLIIFFTLGGVYLLGGVLYSRCVLNARGYDQIPNKDSWINFGNLTADGCSFVCRCAERQEQGAYSDLDSERISTPSMTGHSPITAADDDTLLDM